MRLRLGVPTVLLAGFVTTAHAQSLDQELPTLASRLARVMAAAGVKTVAAVDFINLQGQATELGRYVAERLALEIVAAGGVTVADRATIKAILAEHQLTEEGLVHPENAKKLGEFAGVQAILTGTLSPVSGNWEALVKAVSTGSATIVAAGRITFPVSSENQQLGNLRVSSPLSTQPAGGGSLAPNSRPDPGAIAQEDVGSLRIVLRSIQPMRRSASNNAQVRRDAPGPNAIRCTFELFNRETQRSIHVAMNAELSEGRLASDRGLQLGSTLRSSLVDGGGTQWNLPVEHVTAIGVVGVGQIANRSPANPSEVGALLERREATGNDVAGTHSFGGPLKFVFGSTTAIAAGQRMIVTMDFVQPASSTGSVVPTTAQLTAEVVIGTESAESKRSYRLHNLMFDRISLPRQ